MPNAKELIEKGSIERILMRGSIGTGKTMQFLTLPGKKFLYVFEASSFNTIQGYDVTYEAYLAEKLNITVKAIPKGLKIGEGVLSKDSRLKAQAYAQFEEHFHTSLDNGYFDQFDTIGLDSITSIADIMLDDILARDGRMEYPPVLNDYNILKTQIARLLRALCALDKLLFVTAHTMYRQTNEASRKLLNEILIPGDLQVRAPLLFSTVLQTYYETTTSGKKFMVQSVIDNHNENLKSSIPGLLNHHDVTIENLNNPQASGLGKLIVDAKYVYERRAKAAI